ncbi:hypothetical protein Tco_0579200 [Tanacetum coccineum]
MPKRRTSNRVTRIPLKFGDSVYNITSKKNKHKIDNAEGNKDSGCDEYDDESRDSVDEEDCTKEDNGDSGKQGYEMDDAQVRDEMRENVEESIESDKQSQSNVSPADPVTITTSNVENDVIKAKNDQMHEMHDNYKNYNESYAKNVRIGYEELNKDLQYIPTGINENRDEVVIFEKELVREGSKKWQLTLLNVRLEAWSVRGISALASRLGKPVMMDNITASMCHKGSGRAGYARILVEIDAKKGIQDQIEIVYKDALNCTKKTKFVKVEYNRKLAICAQCGGVWT